MKCHYNHPRWGISLQYLISGRIQPQQGTEIFNFGARSPRIFLNFLHWIFFPLSPGFLCSLWGNAPKCGESCPIWISGRRKNAESCHVSGCHGFSQKLSGTPKVYCGVSLSPQLWDQRGTALQMGGRTAVQIGGVPPVLLMDKLYGLGIPKRCPFSIPIICAQNSLANGDVSGVAPANQTKERAKTKSSWISPIFVNSGVFP